MSARGELFALTTKIRALDAYWDREVPDDLEAMAEMRSMLVERISEVGAELALWAEERGARAEMFEAMAEKLNRHAARLRQSELRAREAIRDAMLEQGMSRIDGELVSLQVVDSPEAVELEPDFDLDLLPVRYLRVSAPQPDRKALKEALKEGVEIPGVALVRHPVLRTRFR